MIYIPKTTHTDELWIADNLIEFFIIKLVLKIFRKRR